MQRIALALVIVVTLVASCSRTTYSVPAGKVTAVVLDASATEVITAAELAAETIGYVRFSRDGDALFLDAKNPKRSMLIGPGTNPNTYSVVISAWNDSDVPVACADSQKMSRVLAQRFPSGQVVLESGPCAFRG